ncbi:MAG: HNH endonuclease [Lachnospiraceae bacterium]|nr:HNH endonuclease [Lachnospiraceae bacterium]
MGRRLDKSGEYRTAFEKNKKIILKTQRRCALCGQEVDKNLKYPHPMSASVDHIIPLQKGGHPSDLANLQLAHLYCNRQKAAKLFDAGIGREKLEENKEISNDNLPWSRDWNRYVAKDNDKEQEAVSKPAE